VTPTSAASNDHSAVSAIAGTATGNGYWVVTQGGSVYAVGSAQNYGGLTSLGVTPAEPVIGIVPTPGTGGYLLVGLDGGIYAFGNATFAGSLPALGLHVADIVGAVPT
jgi:hypothetical protein